MAKVNTADVGFEKQIWNAADVLRGSMDAAEYKHVVLGLIFLKYISDRFEAKYHELVNEGYGMEEDKDEYTAENIFYVPQNARWSVIAGNAHKPEIGIVIDEAMRLIENENERLKGVLPKNFARPELDKQKLGDVVDLFTNIQMKEQGESKDILGRTYEYCLSMFASAEGKNAGEFYTPSCIVRTLVEVLKPYHGRVYDPACGSGGMFVQSAKFIERHQGKINDISVFGQEYNPTTWKMAQMNLAIRGIEANLGDFNADIAYNNIYNTAKESIYIIDNYIGIKTLLLIKNIKENIKVCIFSDNIGKGLHQFELNDFQKQYPNIDISFYKTNGFYHDRYIIIDYKTPNENIFHCGASSKDAGKKITSINKINDKEIYHHIFDILLNNPILTL